MDLKLSDTQDAARETAREFAEKELNLKANGHYLKYADLNRRF